jgi:tetratricopeptide (TPR) repeat protein
MRRMPGARRKLLMCGDQEQTLTAQDLESLARAAYMLGRDEEYAHSLERAYRAYLAAGDVAAAACCTWWVGHGHLFRGEPALARGWFARGRRLFERAGDCVARGYLAITMLFEHSGRLHRCARWRGGDRRDCRAIRGFRPADDGHDGAGKRTSSVRATRRGPAARGRDDGRGICGRAFADRGWHRLLQHIVFCRDLYELRTAWEWTSALTEWCARQPEMLAHQRVCLVHRAELMTLAGAWPAALEAARQAAERFAQGVLNRRALGEAAYREGELHRLRGEVAAAEKSYQEAMRRGREPQPGLALLRLGQGKKVAAAASVRRALSEADDWARRASLLPAQVESWPSAAGRRRVLQQASLMISLGSK